MATSSYRHAACAWFVGLSATVIGSPSSHLNNNICYVNHYQLNVQCCVCKKLWMFLTVIFPHPKKWTVAHAYLQFCSLLVQFLLVLPNFPLHGNQLVSQRCYGDVSLVQVGSNGGHLSSHTVNLGRARLPLYCQLMLNLNREGRKEE